MAIRFFLITLLLAQSTHADFLGLLKKSLEQDAQLNDARLGKLSADYRLLRSKGEFLPSISAFASETKNEIDNIGKTTTTTTGARLNLNLLRFGADYYNLKAAKAGLKGANSFNKATLIERERFLSTLLLEIARQKQNVEIISSIRDLKKKAFEIAKTRYQRGLLSRSDSKRVEIDFENANSALEDARLNWISFKKQAQTYLSAQELPTAYPLNKKQIDSSRQSLSRKSFTTNKVPKVKTRELRELELANQKKAILGAMIGDLDFSLSREKIAGELIDDQWAWRSTLTLTLPLFEQFKDYTDYKQKSVEVLSAKAFLRQERATANAEYENDKLLMQVAYNSLAQRRSALKLSQSVYTNHLKLFNQGKITVNDLLVEQDRLFQTKQSINQGVFRYHQSAFSLCYSLGIALTEGCLAEI